MNRLTKWADGYGWQENHDNDTREWKNGNRACMDRLAAYENTGFSPEEVGELVRARVGTEETTDAQISEIVESMEITQEIASTVCPHMRYSGNRILGNGEVDQFICRYHMEKYDRRDYTEMVIPYANGELIDALTRHCNFYFEEDCASCPGRDWIDPRAEAALAGEEGAPRPIPGTCCDCTKLPEGIRGCMDYSEQSRCAHRTEDGDCWEGFVGEGATE